MIEGFARLEKIWLGADGQPLRPELMAELLAKAQEDKHDLVAPTHVVMKGNEVTGYMSINNVPMVLSWLSTKAMTGRDSLSIINLAELIVAHMGWRSVCLPVDNDSPFHPLMEKMGYKKLADVTLFAKVL